MHGRKVILEATTDPPACMLLDKTHWRAYTTVVRRTNIRANANARKTGKEVRAI